MRNKTENIWLYDSKAVLSPDLKISEQSVFIPGVQDGQRNLHKLHFFSFFIVLSGSIFFYYYTFILFYFFLILFIPVFFHVLKEKFGLYLIKNAN